MPTNASEDRHAPYRRAFEEAATFAYVFDPGRSRENLDDASQRLIATHSADMVTRTNAGRLTLFIVRRR